MTCNNNPSLIDTLQCTIRNTLSGLDRAGLLLYGPYDVFLVYETRTERDPALGRPGKVIDVKKVKMMPRPYIDLNTTVHQDDQVLEKLGTAKLKNIVASDRTGESYTRAQLEGADYWIIGDHEYTLIEGSLTRKPGGVFWEAVLKRRNNGGKLQN